MHKALASDQRNGVSPRFVALGKDSSYIYVDHQGFLHHQLHDYQADVRSVLDGQQDNIKVSPQQSL